AKRSKASKVVKKRTKNSSPQLVDEFVDEGVLENEPRIGDEEADLQKAVEESLKEFHSARQGPLPPVVIRGPESGKFQPLPEVQGKGKPKDSDEQVALDLLTFQTPKKKSPADQFIFQKRTSTPMESSSHDESSSLYAKLGLTDSESESDEEVPGIDAEVQDEGQAGPNPGEQDEGQAGPNPGDVAASQPPPSHVVLAGPDLKHMNLEASNTLIQPNPKQMDDEFTTTAYPNVQENLKLPTEGEVRLEDPFLAEKSHEDEPEKTNIEAEVQSMVTVPIHQDTSSVPLMTTLVIDLTAIQAPLGDHFRDLPEADMKEILHYRMWESNSYQDHEDHKMLYEALEKSMAHDQTDKLLTDLAKARKKKKKRRDLPKTPLGSPPHQPPHPLPPASSSGTPKLLELLDSTDARSSSKTAASAEYTAWTTTDTRLKPSVLLIPEELHMDDATTHDEQVQSSGDEDIGHDHIPTASALASTYAPPTENSLLVQTGDMAIFIDWFCKKQGITELKQQDLEGPAYEFAKVFHPNVIHLQYQMEECYKLLTDQVDESIIRYNASKPLPLGGPPGQVTIQSDFFFNKDLEYLRYGRKSGMPTLSISKMKAAYYPDVGLEQMVLDQIWIEEECKYDIAAIAVRTHMGILSVVRIEVFSLYECDYMKTIILRRADLKEYTIAERDFKYLYPSDFEDLYLLNLQGHLNHIPLEDKKILTTAVNLWTKNLVIRQHVEDFQLGIESYQT
ncbi:E-beta-farnesene synthase, partial [Tanacetum coccineum]